MTKFNAPAEGVSLVCQCKLNLSTRTVKYLADLLRSHLKALRSPRRSLSAGRMAVLVLAMLRHDQQLLDLAGGNGVPESTLRRWHDETIDLLATQHVRRWRSFTDTAHRNGAVPPPLTAGGSAGPRGAKPETAGGWTEGPSAGRKGAGRPQRRHGAPRSVTRRKLPNRTAREVEMPVRTTTGLVAAAAAAALALGALAGCGSSSGPAAAPTSPTATAAPGAGTPSATAFNGTDVAFARNMITLDQQARALSTLAPGRTDHAELYAMAGHMSGYHADDDQLSGWMHDWRQTPPAAGPTGGVTPWPWGSPGTMGPGMMGAGRWHGWDDMEQMNGHAFDAAWVDAAIAVGNAMIAQCRTELAGGVNPQARAYAQHTLTQRQQDLAQLQGWHDSWAHG